MKLCPFCKKNIRISSHCYFCNLKLNNLTDNEIWYKYIEYNFPKISQKEILYNEYVTNLKSLPDIRNEYYIDFKNILNLLDYFQIPKRNASESAKLITVNKHKKYFQSRYGNKITNALSKGTSGYVKKQNTVRAKYNVDNVFQIEEIIKKLHTSELELKRSETAKKNWTDLKRKAQSIKSQCFWDNISDERKNEILSKNFLNKHIVKKRHTISNLETRICKILRDNNISFVSQHTIKYKIDNKTRYFIYDILIPKYNMLIEVQGDYYHANPKIYKLDDKLNFFGTINIANEIWNKDKLKKDIALKNDFNIIYVWEDEIKNKSNDSIKSILIEKLIKIKNENF